MRNYRSGKCQHHLANRKLLKQTDKNRDKDDK